jgi:hypothetical protein
VQVRGTHHELCVQWPWRTRSRPRSEVRISPLKYDWVFKTQSIVSNTTTLMLLLLFFLSSWTAFGQTLLGFRWDVIGFKWCTMVLRGGSPSQRPAAIALNDPTCGSKETFTNASMNDIIIIILIQWPFYILLRAKWFRLQPVRVATWPCAAKRPLHRLP